MDSERKQNLTLERDEEVVKTAKQGEFVKIYILEMVKSPENSPRARRCGVWLCQLIWIPHLGYITSQSYEYYSYTIRLSQSAWKSCLGKPPTADAQRHWAEP